MSLRIRLCFPFSFVSYLQLWNYHVWSKKTGNVRVREGGWRVIPNQNDCFQVPWGPSQLSLLYPPPFNNFPYSSYFYCLTGPIQQLLPSYHENQSPAIFAMQRPFFFRFWATTIILTCFGMQIGRILSVNVISRSRMYIAKSCDSKSLLLKW